MALELKSKPKTKNKVNAAAPSKKTMNFSRHASSFDLRKMAPYLIVIVIVLALFALIASLRHSESLLRPQHKYQSVLL